MCEREKLNPQIPTSVTAHHLDRLCHSRNTTTTAHRSPPSAAAAIHEMQLPRPRPLTAHRLAPLTRYNYHEPRPLTAHHPALPPPRLFAHFLGLGGARPKRTLAREGSVRDTGRIALQSPLLPHSKYLCMNWQAASKESEDRGEMGHEWLR